MGGGGRNVSVHNTSSALQGTHLLISSTLSLHSPLLHSTHDWIPNSSSYRIPILPLRHDTSAITTDCNRSGVAVRCLPCLTFPDFDLAPKRNEKFGFTDLA